MGGHEQECTEMRIIVNCQDSGDAYLSVFTGINKRKII